AAVVARLCRRPALAHALWLLVLLRLVAPPLWVVPLPGAAGPASPPPEGTEAPGVPAPAVERAAPAGTATGGGAIPPPRAPVPAPPGVVPVAEAGPRGLAWQPTACAVWVGGSLLWWCFAARRVLRFRRLLRLTSRAPA